MFRFCSRFPATTLLETYGIVNAQQRAVMQANTLIWHVKSQGSSREGEATRHHHVSIDRGSGT